MGQKFMIKSDSNDDYVMEVANYVDKKITGVIQGTNSVASLNVAILAAMNIADEYFKYQKDNTQRITQAEKKVEDIIELIDLQM